MVDRRGFLSSVAGVLGLSPERLALFEQEAPKLPASSLYNSNEEAYWTEVRKQFVIPADEVYLNNGTVGSSPLPVLRAIFDCYNDEEKMAQSDPEDYPIWGYAAWNEFRDPLAAFVGCNRDEIALLRNATEANSYIANGLDLMEGDEVLMTDQEHPGGEHPWNLRAKRYGIVVKRVTLPRPVPNAAAVLNLFNDAITPRTRVLFFSHITTVTGVVLPAKELCALARSKGIISAVDGAHVPGMMRLNLHELGCDMYSSSPHKWLQAAKGSGFLYVRDEMIDRLWNTIATEGWNDPKLRAERFQRIGSSNVPVLCGLRGDCVCERDWDGADRAAAPAVGGLPFERDGAARGDVVDFAGSGAAVRHCSGERGTDSDWRDRKLDVEEQEDPDSRRGTFEDPAFDAVLFVAEGRRPLPCSVRRISRDEANILVALSTNVQFLLFLVGLGTSRDDRKWAH